MAGNEEQLLRNFQSSGSRDALRELLFAHQDRIYNACFQVLGRAEDAEDAAQEALLKLAEGAGIARDADSFRGWTYRVSFRIALDHWRRREAIKDRESRAAMNRPAAPPLDDRERIALFKAMDGLDDRERSLLLEHYFEKVPLPELGARQGVSAVAIWKRIDRAREKLKKSLLGAGVTLAAAQVSDALEATVPMTAPATLVGEALLGKILAGGVAVGAAKSSMISAIVLALVLLFGISTVGYLLFGSREPGEPPSSGQEMASKPDAPAAPAVPAAQEQPVAVIPATDEGKDPNNALLETLERYRAWYREWREASSRPPDPADPRRNLRLQYEGFKRFAEARQQIFDDIETFLAFLRDPQNEELLDNLVHNLLGKNEQKGEGGQYSHAQKYGDFPPELMEGFLALLKTPNPARRGILRLLGGVHDVPEKFDARYEELMYDPDPAIQYAALYARWRQRPLDVPTLEKILARFDSSTNQQVQTTAIMAISYSPRPETLRWMLDRMETAPEGFQAVITVESAVRMSRESPDDKTLDRISKTLTTKFAIKGYEWAHFRFIDAALELPVSHSIPILEAALPSLADPKLKKGVQVVLDESRKQTLTPHEMRSWYRSASRD